MSAVPFWFVIPLRSAKTAQSWDRVCADLRATVTSLLRQTDPRFRIILSCAEMPDMGGIVDERIEIISQRYDVPVDFAGYARDKMLKKRAAAYRVRQGGGGYVMLVDADDLVNTELVSYVLRDDNRAGYFIKRGFLLYTATNRTEEIEDFWRKCGTSYVCWFDPAELPAGDDSPETPFDAFKNHRLAVETAASQGKSLAALPFAGAVYRLESGENLSTHHPNNRRFSRYKLQRGFSAVWRRLQGRTRPNSILKTSFGLD